MSQSDLPPLANRSDIKYVDMTPDDDLPIRILRSYRVDCESYWVVHGLPTNQALMYEQMNADQIKRAEILDRAIDRLEEWHGDRGEV